MEKNSPGSSQKRGASGPELTKTQATHLTTNPAAAAATTSSGHYNTKRGEEELRVEAGAGEGTGKNAYLECSSKSCRSYSATLLADCVAVCCCPLAVVSCLSLVFIRVPYNMARRCLGKNTGKQNKTDKTVTSSFRSRLPCYSHCKSEGVYSSSSGSWSCSSRRLKFDDFVVRRGGGKSWDIVFDFGRKGEIEANQSTSLRRGLVEMDDMLLELYEGGRFGFGLGRISFTGTSV